MIPPVWCWLKIRKSGHRGIRLGIPLFLLWPLWLLAALLMALLVMALWWVMIWVPPFWKVIKAMPQVYRLLCSLSGTQVEVEKQENTVCVKIY